MSTKALLPGMCNFPVNLTEEERSLLQRQAFAEDRSTGSFIRAMYLEGLKAKYPELARQIEEIRISRRMVQSAAMLVIGVFSITVAVINGDDIRRAPRSVRVVRAWRRAEMEVA
jgi:hypothetical protein